MTVGVGAQETTEHHAAGFALLLIDRRTATVSQGFFASVVEVQPLVLIDIYTGPFHGHGRRHCRVTRVRPQAVSKRSFWG